MPSESLPKNNFFSKLDNFCLAVGFEDVRLKTGFSYVLPDNVSLNTRFSRNVSLRIPFVSAPMDTVTEHKTAIGMAIAGGLGIIHRNLTPEEQEKEVARVKYHLNGLIRNPKFVLEDMSIENIENWRREKGYGFHSFPVLDKSGKLIGIITKNDFDFCSDHSKTAGEIMTRQVITLREGSNLNEAYVLMCAQKKKAIPLVDLEGKLTGLYVFSDLKRIKNMESDEYNLDERGQLRVGAAVGIGDDAFSRIERLVKLNVDVVVIDTAHGDTNPVIQTLGEIKRQYYNLDVVAGNVTESGSAERLIRAGADGIKIGQGGGSICITSDIAGVGCPQVTAVYNCSVACDRFGIPCCSDGGIKKTGDVPKAIGAGAWSVMIGKAFAGTEEAPGELVFREGRQWKEYRGMGSLEAMEKRGSQERYRSGKSGSIAEGVSGIVPYRGPLEEVLKQFVGGLRRGMGYVGAANIEELRRRADFYLRLGSSNFPTDLVVTHEPPNYTMGGN